MNRKERITELIKQKLSPEQIEVKDFSHQHSKGAESHFDVFIVSSAFEGKRQVKRHRIVYQALQSEIDQGMHALQLQTLTPEEYQKNIVDRIEPPTCRGGS